MSERDWRLFRIDGALNENPPDSEDLGEWAAYYDRLAAAAVLLREDSQAQDNPAGVDAADELHRRAVWAAREMRRHQT